MTCLHESAKMPVWLVPKSVGSDPEICSLTHSLTHSQTDSVERRSTRILNTGHFVHKYSVNMHFHRLNVQFARVHFAKWGYAESLRVTI